MPQVAESLEADIMLMRGYTRPGMYQPIFFLILRGQNYSTFHRPSVCYRALGYTIAEESEEEVNVSDVSWAENYQLDDQIASIWVKRLIVFRESEGKIWDRRLVLYFYVKENQLSPLRSDTATMIRVSALIPPDGPYGGMLDITKGFTTESIPYMFEPPAQGEQSEPITAVRLVQAGLLGYLAIAAALLVPLAMIAYPRFSRRRSGV
jgi:hypothetical protein